MLLGSVIVRVDDEIGLLGNVVELVVDGTTFEGPGFERLLTEDVSGEETPDVSPA